MTRYLKIILLLLIVLFIGTFSQAQEPTEKEDYLDISAVINLDSFTVVASREGFSVAEFIQLVKEDDSFLNAFHNLRFLNYKSDNNFTFKSKKDKILASNNCKIKQQIIEENCRQTKVLEENPKGKFYKNKKKREYKFYTSKMHDRLFYAHRKSCTGKDPSFEPTDDSKLEKYVSELKKLIFKPGKKANVPLIGDKTAIFEKKMMKYYDYSIQSEVYKNEIDCYVFIASVKDQYLKDKEGKTVIKYLKTYFSKEDFQVMGRNYQLKYNTALYEFDLSMDIELDFFENKYVPTYIQFEGFWDLPFFKKESGDFTLTFYDFNSYK